MEKPKPFQLLQQLGSSRTKNRVFNGKIIELNGGWSVLQDFFFSSWRWKWGIIGYGYECDSQSPDDWFSWHIICTCVKINMAMLSYQILGYSKIHWLIVMFPPRCMAMLSYQILGYSKIHWLIVMFPPRCTPVSYTVYIYIFMYTYHSIIYIYIYTYSQISDQIGYR